MGDNMLRPDWDDGTSRQWWPTRLVEGGYHVPSPTEVLLRTAAAWLRARMMSRSRRALLDLTDDQLRDIGLTREEARREGRRSFHLD